MLTNVYWIVLGLPWFFLQKKRPGPPIPKGEHWITVSGLLYGASYHAWLNTAAWMETDLQGFEAVQATAVS